MSKRIYIAHKKEVYEDLTHKTCKAIAEQRQAPQYRAYETAMGLADFLSIVTDIKAKHLNKCQQLEQKGSQS